MEEDPNSLIYIALLGLLVLSAFFSATEVAFVSLTPTKVKMLSERKTQASKLVVALKLKPQRLLATILIGNNLVNILASGLATIVATNLFGSAGLGVATGVMTLLILIFGEIFPKAFAQKYAEKFALLSSYPLFFLDKLLTPFTCVMEKMLHAAGAEHTEKVTEEEVVALVGLGAEEGELQKHEKEMIQNVLEFTDTRVEEVMTPRVKIKALSKTATIAEAQKFFRKSVHSRLPIYEGNVDKVVGILTLRTLFEYEGDMNLPIEKLDLLEPIFTPASRPIRALFTEFQSRHIHIAVVVDEHGGTLGITTLEDLLEELVGEIEDEEDISEAKIEQINAKTILASGDTNLFDIDKKLETKLAVGEFENKNIAFLLLEKLGKMPQEDAKIRFGDAEITIEEVKENHITKVKVEKI